MPARRAKTAKISTIEITPNRLAVFSLAGGMERVAGLDEEEEDDIV